MIALGFIENLNRPNYGLYCTIYDLPLQVSRFHMTGEFTMTAKTTACHYNQK